MGVKRRLGAALSGFAEGYGQAYESEQEREVRRKELEEIARRNTGQLALWVEQGVLSKAQAEEIFLKTGIFRNLFEGGVGGLALTDEQMSPTLDPYRRETPDILESVPGRDQPGTLAGQLWKNRLGQQQQAVSPLAPPTPTRQPAPLTMPEEFQLAPEESKIKQNLFRELEKLNLFQAPGQFGQAAGPRPDSLEVDEFGRVLPVFSTDALPAARPGLTPLQRRNLMANYLGINVPAVFGRVGDTPEEQAARQRMLNSINVQSQLESEPKIQATREFYGMPSAGGVTSIQEQDPRTGGGQMRYRTPGGFLRELAGSTTPTGEPLAPGGQLIAKAPVSAGAQERIARAQISLATFTDAMGPLTQMLDRVEEGTWNMWSDQGMVGPFAGRSSSLRTNLPGSLGLDDPVFNELLVLLNMAENATINAITGAAVSEQEAIRIERQIPKVTDRPSMLRAKTLASIRNAEDAWRAYAMQIPLEQYYASGLGTRIDDTELRRLETQIINAGGGAASGVVEVPNTGNR